MTPEQTVLKITGKCICPEPPNNLNRLLRNPGCHYCACFEQIEQAIKAETERCAGIVPTSWLDPLLTGKDAVIAKPPYCCPDIESLLRAIAKAIRSQP